MNNHSSIEIPNFVTLLHSDKYMYINSMFTHNEKQNVSFQLLGISKWNVHYTNVSMHMQLQLYEVQKNRCTV